MGSPGSRLQLRAKRFGLPRDQRIRRRADFLRLQGERGAPAARGTAARVSSRNFLLLLAPSPAARGAASSTPAGRPRLGVVASRKVGGAVQRNRAKRLLREAFRRNPDAFPPGMDLVIVARPGAEKLGLAEVERELQRAAAQLVRRAGDLRGARR